MNENIAVVETAEIDVNILKSNTLEFKKIKEKSKFSIFMGKIAPYLMLTPAFLILGIFVIYRYSI